MDLMLKEILEMPEKAAIFWETPSYTLPLNVPYLGMGSSYFAPLAFKYMGLKIFPEIASEYFYYLVPEGNSPLAVILSQSGKSTEALWCANHFESYIAVTNDVESTLATLPNVTRVVPLLAGEERYSSSKTYINTLLALFKGFGMDAGEIVEGVSRKMDEFHDLGKTLAEKVYEILSTKNIHGIYITGSGPNIATASQAALILSESTKLAFQGLSMAQYDHGPKETAANSIVVQILAPGVTLERSMKLGQTVSNSGAYIFSVSSPEVAEPLSILTNIIPFNFMAYYLAKYLNVGETFVVGGKVTEVL